MGIVNITFVDGSVKHFVDAICCSGVLRIHVHQYQEGNKIKRYHFDIKQIKSVSYDA